jgi:hypothetical protein
MTTGNISIEKIERIRKKLRNAISILKKEGYTPRRIELYWAYRDIFLSVGMFEWGGSRLLFERTILGCDIEFHDTDKICVVGIRGDTCTTITIEGEDENISVSE